MPSSSDNDIDFAKGVLLADLRQGVTAGHVAGEPAMLLRQGETLSLVGGKCTHYGAPLHTGLVRGDRVYCPWHHACFSLRDGGVEKAPGLQGLPRWQLQRQNERVVAGARLPPAVRPADRAHAPSSIGIVGAGAAAHAAVLELCARGYTGRIEVFGREAEAPYDRVKLSKACLAGKADPLSISLPTDGVPQSAQVRWRLGEPVVGLDAKTKHLRLTDRTSVGFDALLWATGAQPRALGVPGESLPHVHVLRSARDAQQLLAALAQRPGPLVIVGASFIGLEAASALRQQGRQVHVVSPHELPFSQVLGSSLAQVLRSEHERQGVHLHRPRKVQRIEAEHVVLDNGQKIPAAVVLLAVGVQPDTALLQQAGLHVDNGLPVDAHLRSRCSGLWAAGDVAKFPLASHGPVRIEHWAVAGQMGRIAARNMLGESVAFEAVPFFWTEHYDYKIRYVGHAQRIERAQVFGDIEKKNAVIALWEHKRIAAVVTVGRDDISLACEAAMAEKRDAELMQLVKI